MFDVQEVLEVIFLKFMKMWIDKRTSLNFEFNIFQSGRVSK